MFVCPVSSNPWPLGLESSTLPLSFESIMCLLCAQKVDLFPAHNRELPNTDISNRQEHDNTMAQEARKLVPFPRNPAVSNYLSTNSGNGCTFQFQGNLIVLLERDNQYFVPCNEEVKQNGYNYFGENRGITLEEHFIFGFV